MKKKDVNQLHIKHVKIAKKCRKALKKTKCEIWGNVLDAIECPEWYIPFDSYDFDKVRAELARTFREFFELGDDVEIEVESYDSNIISYNRTRNAFNP